MDECLSFHYDVRRLGAGPGAQRGAAWQKAATIPLGSAVRAAPLVVQDWVFETGPRAGEMHSLVIVATSDNHVLAYAESHLLSGYLHPLWSTCLGTPVTRGGSNIPPPIGICSTPVVDVSSARLFACAYVDLGNSQSEYRMVALDLDTGVELQSAPLVDAGAPGRPQFDPAMHDQRGALNLVGGWVYGTFAAFYAYDIGNYHGWIVGCNAGNLAHQRYFSTTRNVLAGGVWGPGGAASDGEFLFAATGNATAIDDGYWNALPVGQHPGDIDDYFIGVVKLGVAHRGRRRHLEVRDWFQPSDARALNDADLDLGSSSCLVLPQVGGRNLLVLSAKSAIYLLDRDHLGHWGPPGMGVFSEESHSAPAHFRAPGGEDLVYFSGGGSPGLICYRVSGGTSPALHEVWRAAGGTVTFDEACSSPTVGIFAGSHDGALVWVANGGDTTTGVLHAYDALTGTEVYRSDTHAADALGALPHYPGVTCAGKSVYVGTRTGLALYRTVDTTVTGLVMAWKGVEGDDGIYFSSFDGAAWASQELIAGVGTSHGPSLAVYDRKVYMIWKGVDGDQGIYFSHFNGHNWAPQRLIPGTGTSVGPALAQFNGVLFAAWKGVAGDDGIYYSWFDGSRWASQRRFEGGGTSVEPSLAAHDGRLYMAWKGIEGDDGIYYSSFAGDKWLPQQLVPGIGTSVAPTLTSFNGTLVMAWKGVEGDQGIYFTVFDRGGWAPQGLISGVGTSIGPSLGVFKDRLYLAWKGVEGDQGIYFMSFDGAGFSSQQNLAGVGTSVGPSLCWIGL
jgi:hypothetical protein